MLHIFTAYAELDGPRLMAVYAESNRENTDYFFPDMTDKALAVERVEEGFLQFLRDEFSPVLAPRTMCWRRRGSGSAPCG